MILGLQEKPFSNYHNSTCIKSIINPLKYVHI